jgi:protein associated with RNAse G/E
MPQRSILGSLFLLICINDLSTVTNKDNNMVLFADDTNIIITDSNRWDFNTNADQMFQDINTWFNVNRLSFNFNKT